MIKLLYCMKKSFYSWLFCLVMACLMPLCFVSCSSDDDSEELSSSSALVGKWYHVKDVFDYTNLGELTEITGDGEVEECGSKDCYWTFTEDKCTIHDVDDLMNNRTFTYTYEGKKLYIEGVEHSTVKKLTSSELILFTDMGYMTQTMYFKR